MTSGDGISASARNPNVLKTAKWDHELSLKQLAATQSLAVEDDALQQAKYGLNSQDWIEVLGLHETDCRARLAFLHATCGPVTAALAHSERTVRVSFCQFIENGQTEVVIERHEQLIIKKEMAEQGYILSEKDLIAWTKKENFVNTEEFNDMEQLFDGIYSVASNRLNVCKLALEEMFQYDPEYSAWVESEYFLNRAIEWCTSSRNRHSLSAIAQYIYCNDRLDGEIGDFLSSLGPSDSEPIASQSSATETPKAKPGSALYALQASPASSVSDGRPSIKHESSVVSELSDHSEVRYHTKPSSMSHPSHSRDFHHSHNREQHPTHSREHHFTHNIDGIPRDSRRIIHLDSPPRRSIETEFNPANANATIPHSAVSSTSTYLTTPKYQQIPTYHGQPLNRVLPRVPSQGDEAILPRLNTGRWSTGTTDLNAYSISLPPIDKHQDPLRKLPGITSFNFEVPRSHHTDVPRSHPTDRRIIVPSSLQPSLQLKPRIFLDSPPVTFAPPILDGILANLKRSALSDAHYSVEPGKRIRMN